MNIIDAVFGSGKDLNILQMASRGIVVFVLALILLRIAGRRAFGMRTPLDNIVVILLGAVLSRAVVGASPFFPVIVCSLFIVLMHRWSAWLTVRSKVFSRLIQGNHIILFEQGHFLKGNMDKALVCRRDLENALRNKAATEDFGQVTKMYMEHNGEITVIKSA